MRTAQQLILTIRNQCDRTSVDFDRELESYDRLNKGIISPVSLHRWISSIGLNFSAQQVQTIAGEFKEGEGVDWKALSNAINNAKNVEEEVSTKTPDCQSELKAFYQTLQDRGQTLREVLKQYDPSNRRKVSSEQFIRAFGYNQVTKIIVRYYADTVTGYIDYLKLQADLQAISTVRENPDEPVKDVPDSFEDLARFIKSRSIDLPLLFRRYDQINQGRIARAAFEAAISSIGANLQPRDLKEIAKVFVTASGECNYKKFIATVEDFKPKPTERVRTATLRSEMMKPKINPDEILETLKAIIKARRIDVNDYFVTMPKEGYPETIPVRIFVQIVESMRASLAQDEIKAIAEKFYDDKQQVDYKAFIKEVSPQVTTTTFTTIDVIQTLKKHIATQQGTFAQYASRYDREQSGCISCNQLISVLQFLNFSASSQEIAMIRDAFPGKIRGSIAWKDLAAEIDTKQPEMRTSRYINNDGISKRDPAMTAKPPKAINEILVYIKKYVTQKNIPLQSVFTFYDRRQRGCINFSDFAEALATKRIPCTMPDVRALQSFFRMQSSQDIDYREFIDAVNNAEEIVEEVVVEEPKVQKLPEFPPVVHNFLARFKSFAQTHRFTPVDIFEQFDNTKTGMIQVFKVAAAFSSVQFPAMRAELEDLCSSFRDPRRKECFNYQLFLRALDEEDITSALAKSKIEGEPISASVDREALTTCLMIKEKLMSRRRHVINAFAGITTDSISKAEFQSRLENLNILLSSSQLNSLSRKYRYGITNEIKWRAFCDDVEKSRTVGF